jgi:transaldolase / glucose-6-phosphate isomerase
VSLAERLWAKDDTIWGPAGRPEVANRLGWLDAPETYGAQLDDLLAFADEVRDEGFTDVVLLGMGGSSLAAEVVRQSTGDVEGRPRLHVLDTTDLGWVHRVEGRLRDPLFLVSTKSGGTIETLTGFEHFWRLFADGRRFVAVTDPGSSLIDVAHEHGFRRVFENDPDIGGRYSALSWFGLVPAALMGADVRGIVATAREAAAAHRSDDAPGFVLGRRWAEEAQAGRDKLTFVVEEPLSSLGLWAEQLVAESTGKEGKGILPVADEPEGVPHGPDRQVLRIGPDGDLRASSVADLGRVWFTLEVATAVAGHVLGINPFDQPNVQEAKDKTKAVLEGGDVVLQSGLPSELAKDLAPPSYLAILGFMAADPAVDAAIAELRRAVSEAHGVATTFGYGPRYLHSTGQLHKGGPPTGRFLVLVHDEATDDVFTPLKHAQAAGDLQTLQDHGLPAELVVLGGDPAEGIRTLIKELT